MRAILLSAFSINFLIYALAIRWLFATPFRMPGGMRALSAVGILVAVTHLTFLATAPLTASSASVALALYAIALSLFLWAAVTIRRQPLPIAFSDLTPVRIRRDGPYRFLRHPFYLSYSLTWIAGAIATGSLIVGTTMLLMGTIYLLAARREEQQLLLGPLSEEYRQYRAQTALILPRLLERTSRIDPTKSRDRV